MKRSVVDREGMRSEWAERIRAKGRSRGHGFKVTRLGHVALHVANLERSVAFYTEVLGFEVSDVYPATMMPGGMVFLRFNADHHGIALVGGAESRATSAELHHVAFEVGSLDEVVRAKGADRAHYLLKRLLAKGSSRPDCWWNLKPANFSTNCYLPYPFLRRTF